MAKLSIDNFYSELLEEYPCENKDQSTKREGEWIRERGTVNKRIENRTKQEYRNDTKDKKKEYDYNYRQENRDMLNEKKETILRR